MYGVSLWRYISSDWDSFKQFFRFDVGNGAKVRFWHDLWQGETSFKDRYLTLYQIVLNGDAMIADYLEFGNGQLHWNLLFHQALQDWESK